MASDEQGLIAFSGNQTGSQEIYTINADGSGLRQLTSTSGYSHLYGDQGPDLSPDGTLIAYVHNPGIDGFPGQVFIMRADGTEQRQITHLGVTAFNPEFSPDGQQVVFDTHRAIYTVNLSGSHLHRLVGTHGEAEYSEPTYSPDGRFIAFSWNRHRKAIGRFQVDLMRVDGSHRRQLTHGPGNAQGPAFSPDGSQVAFVNGIQVVERGHDGAVKITGAPQIYTMDLRSKHKRQLTHNPRGSFAPAFSPSGSEIVFVSNQSRRWNNDSRFNALHVMQADGSGERALTGAFGGLFSLSWR